MVYILWKGMKNMEQWKPEQVQKIWQRVQDQNRQTVIDMPTISELFWEEWQDSRLLSGLSGYFRGKNGELLRRMAREDQNHAAVLKKNHLDADVRIHNVFSQKNNLKIHPKLQLQRCYERKLKRLAVYQKRQADPLFQKLARQEQNHCRILLNILGKNL